MSHGNRPPGGAVVGVVPGRVVVVVVGLVGRVHCTPVAMTSATSTPARQSFPMVPSPVVPPAEAYNHAPDQTHDRNRGGAGTSRPGMGSHTPFVWFATAVLLIAAAREARELTRE